MEKKDKIETLTAIKNILDFANKTLIHTSNNKNTVFYKYYSPNSLKYPLDSLDKKCTFFTEINKYQKNDKSELFKLDEETLKQDMEKLSYKDLTDILQPYLNKKTFDKVSFFLENIHPLILKCTVYSFCLSLKDFFNTTFKAFCLTEHENNERMWIEFADNYKGVCIGYKVKKNDFCFFQKMNYVDKEIVEKHRKLDNDFYESSTLDECLNAFLNSLFLKNNDKSFELEHRLLTFSLNNEQKEILEPTELILGKNFTINEQNIKIIKEFRKRNLPIYKYNGSGNKLIYEEDLKKC